MRLFSEVPFGRFLDKSGGMGASARRANRANDMLTESNDLDTTNQRGLADEAGGSRKTSSSNDRSGQDVPVPGKTSEFAFPEHAGFTRIADDGCRRVESRSDER